MNQLGTPGHIGRYTVVCVCGVVYVSLWACVSVQHWLTEPYRWTGSLALDQSCFAVCLGFILAVADVLDL